jgi:mono/diheme cytochrome c family protein
MLAQTAPAASPDAAAPAPQVEAGKAAYAEQCAACHGEDLIGFDHAPSLKGDVFWASFNEKPARQLYSRIISTMPLSDPGSLEPKMVLDITTFILSVNNQALPATGYASADELNTVTITQPAE